MKAFARLEKILWFDPECINKTDYNADSFVNLVSAKIVRTILVLATLAFVLPAELFLLLRYGIAEEGFRISKACRSTAAGVICVDADPRDPAVAAINRQREILASLDRPLGPSDYYFGDTVGACPIVAWRNGILYVDCGAATDLSSYFIDEQSGEIISICGGACWRPQTYEQIKMCKTLCPPPGFRGR